MSCGGGCGGGCVGTEGFVTDLTGSWIEKAPGDRKDYHLDFGAWLAPYNDTLTSVVWVAAAGITLDGSPSTTADSSTQYFLGGTDGVDYGVEVTATTTGGRILVVGFTVRVRGPQIPPDAVPPHPPPTP